MRKKIALLGAIIAFGVTLLLGQNRSEVYVSAATDDMLEILNGENKLYINYKEVAVGDSGDGWTYSEVDTLKLTGGTSITSIIVTDDFEDGLGKRNFTIDVTGDNTITVQKGSNIRFNTEETRNGIKTIVPKIHYMGGESICVYGSLKLTGSGTLTIKNTASNPATHVIQSNGYLTFDGPSVTVDMANAVTGYHAASSMAWISETKSMKGTIYFNKGSLEVVSFGSDTSALFAPEGMVIAKGTTIMAGLDKASSKKVTLEEFWNFNEFGGGVVGPDPTMYQYMKLSVPVAVTKPGTAVIKSIKSSAIGKVSTQITELPGVAGYELVYSSSSKFTSGTTKKVTVTKLSYTLTKLKSGKKYYIKIRAYVLDENGNKVYGSYSKVKSITVK